MINNEPVKEFELERYLGTWYEIGRYPHRFERNLAGVTATYSLREDGMIRVINQGFSGGLDGKLKRLEGKAKTTEIPSRLKVSFFWIFYSDYRILALDHESYQWAIVGSSSPNFLWILAREPEMEEALYQQLLQQIREKGYDIGKLEKVPHRSPGP